MKDITPAEFSSLSRKYEVRRIPLNDEQRAEVIGNVEKLLADMGFTWDHFLLELAAHWMRLRPDNPDVNQMLSKQRRFEAAFLVERAAWAWFASTVGE